jgi:hypothetical protein
MQAVKFYLFAVGDIVGVPQHFEGRGNNAILALGLILVLLSLLVLASYGIRRDERGGSPIGVALIVVGLLFVGTVDAGRIIFGYSAASASRYTTYDLLLPIGIVLALFNRPPSRTRRPPLVRATERNDDRSSPLRFSVWINTTGLSAARGIIAVVILLQIVVGTYYGLEGARSNHTYQVNSAQVLRNIDHSSNDAVVYHVDVFSTASFIRREVRIAQRHHLSLFAGGSGP